MRGRQMCIEKMLPDLNAPMESLKEFADVSAIITDLDGTIVTRGEEVFGQLKNIQKKSERQKLTYTIATGRTYAGAEKIAQELCLKNIPIALYNGAVVLKYQTKQIVDRKTISNSVLADLCGFIDMQQQYLLAYYLFPVGESGMVEMVHGFGKRAFDYDVNGMEIIWHDCFEEVTVLETASGQNMLPGAVFEPCSILLDIQMTGSDNRQLIGYLERCSLISSTCSGHGFWEICARGVNKSVILQYFNHGKCVAIGDNDNDAALLEAAEIGVAVGNGSSSAKCAAKYICREDGVRGFLELISTIQEAKRYWGEGM